MNNYDDEEEEVQVPLPPHKVRYNEMPSNAFRAVVEIADKVLTDKKAMDKDTAMEMARRCKDSAVLETIGEGEWQCIIGTNFGASLTYDTKCLALFDMTEHRKSVMIFRSG